MNMTMLEYLEDIKNSRNKKCENEKDEKDKNFYWGQICLIDEIIFDIKNGIII